MVTGRCDEPTVVFIDGSESGEPAVDWKPAQSLWGMSARDAENEIRRAAWNRLAGCLDRAGGRTADLLRHAEPQWASRRARAAWVPSWAPSESRQSPFVAGSERLPHRLSKPSPSPSTILAFRSGLRPKSTESLGTVSNLLVFNRFDALPTRNFQGSHFEGAGRLAAADLDPGKRIARASCASCTIGCEHIYAVAGNSAGVRLEYESLYALGPMCGVDDSEAVLAAARACDDAGIDTITTGATIAFLMQCSEEGLVEQRLPSGRALRFGDPAALIEAVTAILSGQGRLPDLLRAGSRRAAEQIGGRAPSFAPHVKGLELPGYDPRSLHTMALGLAVGTRGADHNRSAAYEADFSERTDRLRGGADSALFAIETEDRAAVMDSLILCKFLRGVFDDFYLQAAELLAAVTGWAITAAELHEVARRVVAARKCLNQREGWTNAEDTLPPSLLEEGEPCRESPRLSRERLETMIAAYYQARGWDQSGRLPLSLRQELALDSSAFGIH